MSQADSTNTTGASGAGLEGLYLPTVVSPEQVFQAIGQLRKEARDEIDRLVRFLDKTDDYVSRELEVEDGNDEPNGDDEPSLGFLDHMTNQDRVCEGDREFVDSEDEHDGAEPDEDGEPSLGAFEGHENHDVSWAGETFVVDAELDRAELSGIGDLDGLNEQAPLQDWQNRGFV
jgi:hypothetical protein